VCGPFHVSSHIIDYEHTFIACFAGFNNSLYEQKHFHLDFANALETQRLLDAVIELSNNRTWTELREHSLAAS
jgi:hypothetical protein